MSYLPPIAVHPWETLEEFLDSEGITQKELAKRIWTSEKHVSQIINWLVSISPDISLRLEQVFSPMADFWNKLQIRFDETKARINKE